MSKITATFKANGHAMGEVPVINPGGWFGKAWCLHSDFDYVIVEADNLSDAIDELVESEHGEFLRIDLAGSEANDYGFERRTGDIIGGQTIDEPCWLNLKGEKVTDPQITRYLMEPSISGGGVYYDSENLQMLGDEGKDCPFKCLYHGEGIPKGGLTPKDYAELQNYEDEIAQYIGELQNIPPGTIKAFAECYEDAKRIGYDAGFERACEFHDTNYGHPCKLLHLVKDTMDVLKQIPGLAEPLQRIHDRCEQFVNAAKHLRDPRCHIVWRMEGEIRTPFFTWHNEHGRFELRHISACPEETQFTFNRLFEEECAKCTILSS